jgi:coenzyme F420-reducing hydrogenase alpha subunit
MPTERQGLRRVINIDYLSRIEGESGFFIHIKDGRISRLELRVFEAPRFFESFLIGRPYQDAIDFTARICGICPVAYQMSSVHAIEKVFGIEVSRPVTDIRRLMYCAEWISSHSLHVYLLHGPDFYGLESAWSSKGYLPILKKGLSFKRLGDEILSIIGGRPIHPVNVKVGGFFRPVDINLLRGLLPSLERAYEDSLGEIRWAANLKFQYDSCEREYICLRNEDEYPMNYGYIVSNKGLSCDMEGFLNTIEEYQKEYSNALYSGILRQGELHPYLVGPIARLNLNYDRLPEEIKNKIKEAGISIPLSGIDKGIIARVVEISYALYESIRLIRSIDYPIKSQDFEPREGRATWITEAPRGILLHHYEIDERGTIKRARIIPPTSQNLAMIEKDITHLIESVEEIDIGKLKRTIASLIRSYDPCISCSVHLI